MGNLGQWKTLGFCPGDQPGIVWEQRASLGLTQPGDLEGTRLQGANPAFGKILPLGISCFGENSTFGKILPLGKPYLCLGMSQAP